MNGVRIVGCTALAALCLGCALPDVAPAKRSPAGPAIAAAAANSWLEIDQAAFEHNIRTMQALAGRSQLCAVLKRTPMAMG